jgi:hypothetical protein
MKLHGRLVAILSGRPMGGRGSEGADIMLKTIITSLTLTACAVSATAAITPRSGLYEEVLARQEERLIIQTPIAGIKNHFWFDYRNDVGEAQKELSSDLGRGSDTEDLRDAWEEYRHELAHERKHYVKEMAERGYRQGIVEIRI